MVGLAPLVAFVLAVAMTAPSWATDDLAEEQKAAIEAARQREWREKLSDGSLTVDMVLNQIPDDVREDYKAGYGYRPGYLRELAQRIVDDWNAAKEIVPTVDAYSLSIIIAFVKQSQEREKRFWERQPYFPFDSIEKFQLWTGCKPLFLMTPVSVEGGSKLTAERLRTAVESRLRAARIYIETSEAMVPHPSEPEVFVLGDGPYLAINVNIIARAFRFDILFKRAVTHLPVSYIGDPRFSATTWGDDTAGLGTHTNDAAGDAFILATIIEQVDSFINEYLRVNADSCK